MKIILSTIGSILLLAALLKGRSPCLAIAFDWQGKYPNLKLFSAYGWNEVNIVDKNKDGTNERTNDMDIAAEEKMKLAVKKESGEIPGAGFHYMLMPIRLENDRDAFLWERMGHIIIEVDDVVGERLLKESGAALRHQYEVATIAEETLARGILK